MKSRWLKALLVVALVWVAITVGKSVVYNVGLGILPRFISLGDNSERAERSEASSSSAEGLKSVLVQSRNGRIIIVGNDDDEVCVTAKYLAKAGSQAAAQDKLDKMLTSITTVDGQLQIKADFGASSVTNQQIDYELSVPRGLLVRVDTSNGDISADGMTGRLELGTANGDIDVRSSTGPQEVQATTSNGSISVSGNPTAGHYTLQSSNGRVEATLPTTLGVLLDMSTQNGSLDIGEGQWNISGGKISGKQVTATRGNGALKLTMKTMNGSVKLETK